MLERRARKLKHKLNKNLNLEISYSSKVQQKNLRKDGIEQTYQSCLLIYEHIDFEDLIFQQQRQGDDEIVRRELLSQCV